MATQTTTKSPTTMEELLASAGASIKTFSAGQKIKAKLLSVDRHSAYFDIGGKSEGLLADEYFDEAKIYLEDKKPGDELDVEIISPETKDGYIRLSMSETVEEAYWGEIEKVAKEDGTVKVLGRAVSGRGLVVAYGPFEGFVPGSHLSSKASKKPEKLVDTYFEVKIVDNDRAKGRLVFSEKFVSEADEIMRAKKALDALKIGKTYTGTVTQVTSFGAFVEIKALVEEEHIPVEGLVHISELSWEKVGEASDVISEGDVVEVQVLSKDKGKLSLSVKQAVDDPWETIDEKYAAEDKVKGTVVKMSDFGAFIELEPGVEGLLHITKIPPGTDMGVGKEVSCYVIDVDKDNRKISLGLVLTAKPVGYR